MKNRNYKRIYRPGTLMRIQGSNCVFMSLGLNPRNNKQIFSFYGIDIVERKAVTRADGRARPANKWEQNTYWAVMKEIIDKTPSLHFNPHDALKLRAYMDVNSQDFKDKLAKAKTHAVWNHHEHEYPFSGTLEECKAYCDEHDPMGIDLCVIP